MGGIRWSRNARKGPVVPGLATIARQAISDKICPGLVVLIADAEGILVHEAHGSTGEARDGGEKLQKSAIFDVASLAKASSTACILMRLFAQGALSPETPISSLLEEFRSPEKQGVEVRHLMGHASGLPPHLHFYDQIWSGDLDGQATPRDALVSMAAKTKLAYTPGSKTAYSDLGYIVLGRVIELATGLPLEEVFAREVSRPLNMVDSSFVGSGEVHPKLDRVVMTDRREGRGLIRGQVHDDNAFAGGGICGHAGLFSTSHDLYVQARELLAAWHGESTHWDREIVRRCWSESAAPNTTWKLGWDSPTRTTDGISQAGDFWPADGVGHLGFTGTAWWLDPRRRRIVIILSNRVYYGWEMQRIRSVRRAIMHEAESLFRAR